MRALGTLAVGICLASASPALAAAPKVSVSGNQLVDASGAPLRLLGANRSGTEYACAQGWGFTDSPNYNQPDSAALIAVTRTWKANAVRVPLNEACWLGINGVKPNRGGSTYRRKLATYVHRLEAAGLHPILDLH